MNKIIKSEANDFPFGENQYENTSTSAEKLFSKKTTSKTALMFAAGAITLVPNIAKCAEYKIEKGSNSNIEFYNNTVAGLSDYFYTLKHDIIKQRFDKKEIIKKILSFKMLNENWDGYGAYPLEAESAANAIEFIDKIGEELYSKINDVYPNPNGTISFDWYNNSDEIFSLEIGNEEVSYYLELTEEETIYKNNRPINDKEIEDIKKFIIQI